ncbi:MAG: RNHCP domain-containing protein [Phycisphaeraceae bacterium]|nr:RNHCP domain-containing protein [Phycisphaeraceae bacterium]
MKSEANSLHHHPRPNADGFTCAHCHRPVPGTLSGTKHRNHCPICLWSLHVDHQPGDRSASCGGAMEPIAITVKPNGEWAILHRCQNCGAVRINRVAGDDNELALISLALRPLAQPCFPLDQLADAIRPHKPPQTRPTQ